MWTVIRNKCKVFFLMNLMYCNKIKRQLFSTYMITQTNKKESGNTVCYCLYYDINERIGRLFHRCRTANLHTQNPNVTCWCLKCTELWLQLTNSKSLNSHWVAAHYGYNIPPTEITLISETWIHTKTNKWKFRKWKVPCLY